jgi:hypothetical protein
LPLDPDPDSESGSGSKNPLNPDPIRIRIQNPGIKCSDEKLGVDFFYKALRKIVLSPPKENYDWIKIFCGNPISHQQFVAKSMFNAGKPFYSKDVASETLQIKALGNIVRNNT